MGKYSSGILGSFRGKIGTVIGSQWRGIHYMRAKSGPRTGNFSAAQLEQQARFRLATRFMQPLNPVFRLGYQTQAGTSTPLNVALSTVIREVVKGTYPDLFIDYAALRISKGTLFPVFGATAVFEGTNIRFDWVYQPEQAGTAADDRALLVVVSESGEATYSLLQVNREAQTTLLAVPNGVGSGLLHCYIGMVAASGREVSNSIYAGSLERVV
jgi:hypothetical protein